MIIDRPASYQCEWTGQIIERPGYQCEWSGQIVKRPAGYQCEWSSQIITQKSTFTIYHENKQCFLAFLCIAVQAAVFHLGGVGGMW